MASLDPFFQQWRDRTSSGGKDLLVAQALGLIPKEGDQPPHYSTDLNHARAAMDAAWQLMEESAPVRIVINKHHADQVCHVEWWPDDGDHFVTPNFNSEAESRAFAAFAFAELEKRL